MASNVLWMRKILRKHSHYPKKLSRRPQLFYPRNKITYQFDDSGHLVDRLISQRSPADAQRLDALKSQWDHHARTGQKDANLLQEHMDAELRRILDKYPDIKQTYLLTRYYMETGDADRKTLATLKKIPWLAESIRHDLKEQRAYPDPAHLSWAKRLTHLDHLLFKEIKKRHLRPTSFLDAGAAFSGKREEKSEPQPLPAQTTLDSKEFFDKNGVPMKYTALDIDPITTEKQRMLLKKGILAFQQDYRKRPVSKKYSIVRLANVSIHQSRTEFIRTLRNLTTVLEPNGLLVIYNRGSKGTPIVGMGKMVEEIGIYQKIGNGERARLREVLYREE